MKSIPALALAAVLATSQAGCLGSNSAFTKVHRWNETATGNNVANSVIHVALWIVPVYELSLLGDLIIFNNVEFVTKKPVF